MGQKKEAGALNDACFSRSLYIVFFNISDVGKLPGKGSDKENLMGKPASVGQGRSTHGGDMRAMSNSNRGNNSLNKTPGKRQNQIGQSHMLCLVFSLFCCAVCLCLSLCYSNKSQRFSAFSELRGRALLPRSEYLLCGE